MLQFVLTIIIDIDKIANFNFTVRYLIYNIGII